MIESVETNIEEGVKEELLENSKDPEDVLEESNESSLAKRPLSRRAHLSKKKSNPKKNPNLHVRFNDFVKVNEFENDSQSTISDEELRRKEDIIKNMFQVEEEEETKVQISVAERLKGSWVLASSMLAASKRLASYARSSLTVEKQSDDPEKRKEESDVEENDNFSLASENFATDNQLSSRLTSGDNSKMTSNENVKAIRRKARKTNSNPVSSDSSNKKAIRNQRRQSTPAVMQGLQKQKGAPYFQPVRNEKTDPFQFFEVKQEPCRRLVVRVVCGRNISKGRIQDMIDTPDPYVVVLIKEAPDGRKATRTLDNDTNPVWDEKLVYLLPSDEDLDINAEIFLMDSNYSMDEEYGRVKFNISSLPLHKTIKKTFQFNQTSEVDIEFFADEKIEHDLRSSLALCDEEKAFRRSRKDTVLKAMRKLMEGKANAPRVIREVPIIAVLGSGGGFRAMTGYSGAMKALHDTGILDCVTYVCGLSGSSWYLASLYAHDDFPEKGTDALNSEIRSNIQTSPFWLLRPECLMRYSQRLRQKMKSGQPVTFTDFFGMLIGQTLLGPKKMNTAKLSDFTEKTKNGKAPMPLLTCLHVRPKTSALTFHDWVEFTPFEIGIAKYGTFMQTKNFGSKFYKGVLAKQFTESPLHFLMGVWGSAFSILFNRLVDKSKNNANGESKSDDFRQEMQKELQDEIRVKHDSREEDSDVDYDSDSSSGTNNDDNGDHDNGDDDNGDDDDDDEFEDARDDLIAGEKSSEHRKNSGMLSSLWNWGSNKNKTEEVVEDKEKPKKAPKKGFLNSLAFGVFGAKFMESREYRAGKILNYMRGLSLSNTYPLSPFSQSGENNTIAEEGEFQQIHEAIEVQQKRVHLVDAGLTFNSPYPAMLRPQRSVDLILSFDFSARPGENVEPFKEILLAEKWAKLHHLPFPKIDRTVYEKNGMKECYVFKDDEDENAPTIIHFVLCNVKFRDYVKPGVPRSEGDQEGNFNIFDAPKSPYSTFNFQYSNQAFDRLHRLMEFNTLLHVDTILEEFGNSVSLRRHSKTRGSVSIRDIKNSVYLSEKNRESLEKALLSSGEEARLFLD